MFRFLSLAAFGLFVSTSAMAAEIVITQSDSKFSEKKVTLKAGDSIKFVNEDEVAHNVHSTTDGHEFDTGSMQPGSDFAQTFAAAGKVKIRCAIHPKMKMTVMVE